MLRRTASDSLYSRFCQKKKYNSSISIYQWIIKIFGNNLNKSKFYWGRNQEQIAGMEYLFLFGAEYFVIQFAIKKFKD